MNDGSIRCLHENGSNKFSWITSIRVIFSSVSFLVVRGLSAELFLSWWKIFCNTDGKTRDERYVERWFLEPLKFTRFSVTFFFLSLEIYARANETSVAYDDTKDINTGKGNCFASNRCRSKCASSCNRDARGEMFSVKDYRCVRFLIIIGVTFNKPEFWLLRSLV